MGTIQGAIRTRDEETLRGYRFRVCRTADDVARALAVRRAVYVDELGNGLPIPDRYDDRSVLLLAEDDDGMPIGTIRLTPRVAGPLEVEEHFTLPDAYRAPDTVEITRFTILAVHRGTKVMAGLLKLAVLCLQAMDARGLVAGATPARIGTYAWLNMASTGLVARYDGVRDPVTLMACDFAEAARNMEGHPLCAFLFDVQHPQIEFDRTVRAALRGWSSVRLAG